MLAWSRPDLSTSCELRVRGRYMERHGVVLSPGTGMRAHGSRLYTWPHLHGAPPVPVLELKYASFVAIFFCLGSNLVSIPTCMYR